ncbi:hypothetical protein TanjilG_11391 [Lupinus angustifolius]|uniref:MACPF domain-containing protein n=1 Tax=Lupinus angustifolius TaxID=3871 RepID=A0A1J7HMH2_LUPAN|nr:hypothetical protein TanjilG_11391 [Lupinus angustifolius]
MENPTSIRTSGSLYATLANSIQALGRGFDVTSDIRLLYCKGAPGSRLVHLDEDHTMDLEIEVSHGVVVPNVSVDIDCSLGKSSVKNIPMCSFFEMAKYFNEAGTKSLAMVGYFIPLVQVKLTKLNFVFIEEVKRAVPLGSIILGKHLVSLPKNLQPHWDTHMAIGAPKWQGPEEQDSRRFELIKWKNFSHVSTAPIEYTETSIGDLSGVHIVTGAQLGVWDFGAKNVYT